MGAKPAKARVLPHEVHARASPEFRRYGFWIASPIWEFPRTVPRPNLDKVTRVLDSPGDWRNLDRSRGARRRSGYWRSGPRTTFTGGSVGDGPKSWPRPG